MESLPSATETAACPSWCMLPNGHRYDSIDGGANRLHELHLGEGCAVSIVQAEYVQDGVLTYGPMHLEDETTQELTAPEVLQRAQALIALAARFVELTAAS